MNDIMINGIEQALAAMFPHGEDRVSSTRVRHHLEQVAQVAFREGRNEALMGLMTVEDVAKHLGVTRRRASALIRNRHERFGVGMRVGNQWLVHRNELPQLKPDERYRQQ